MYIVFKIRNWDYERSCMTYATEAEAMAALKADYEDVIKDYEEVPESWKEVSMKIDYEQSYEMGDYAIACFTTGDRIEWFCEPATVL